MSEPTAEPYAVTPVYGWHVPVLGDVPNIPSDINTLALGIEATIARDTGWRNVGTSLQYGWTGTVRIRRIARLVQVSVAATSPATWNGTLITTAPAGFTDNGGSFTTAPVVDNAGGAPYPNAIAVVTIGAWLRMFVSPAYTSRQMQFGLTYITDDAWPTTLPGTPATLREVLEGLGAPTAGTRPQEDEG